MDAERSTATSRAGTLRRAAEALSGRRPLWIAALVLGRLVPPVRRLFPDTVVSADALAALTEALLGSWGMAGRDASVTASYLLHADLHGIESHGCSLLPYYHRLLRGGAVTMTPRVEIVRDDVATALLDGGGGLGYVPADTAMKMAIAKCRQVGIGAVSVRNSGHYGAAGAYALMAAKEGLIGLSTTNTLEPAVVPTFGLDAKLGTNPVAFAAPSSDRPFVLDMATSTVSVGRIATAAHAGRSIPSGWALDARGATITNAGAAVRGRRLTPLGGEPETSGYKGYGLGVMVEVLSAVLAGTGALDGDGGPRQPAVGHFFLALDPARFRAAGEFEVDLSALLTDLRATRPRDKAQPVVVPGDPEYAAYVKRSSSGIPLRRSVIEELRVVCRASHVPFTLEASA